MLELLERRARRDPHREPAVRQRVQPGRRRQPGVAGDLVPFECHPRALRKLGDEETRVEAARQDRWRHPPRERRQKVGPQPQVEVERDLGEGRVAADERSPRLRDGTRRQGSLASLGQKDARLLEQLADRGDVETDGDRRLQVTTERDGCVGRGGRRPFDKCVVGVAGIEAAAGEDVHVRRERHRRRSPCQEDLGTARPWAQQDDRRRETWLDRLEGHVASSKVRTNDHSQRPGSYSMSRDVSRTKPRDV